MRSVIKALHLIIFSLSQGAPLQNLWYPEAPDTLTPWHLGNLRNRLTDDMAYYVVIPRTAEDVVAAVQFAAQHNLGISVFSTGHEFNDRNGGPGNNTLLIRTTCLNEVTFDLREDNEFGAVDGVVRMGAGLTWGTSKFGQAGMHELAEEQERVVVSGHAGNVGVVGWSLGGGHGQLVGTYGMGVDQVVQVDLVGADGSIVVARQEGTRVTSADGSRTEESEDATLFWALRGGGAGPWGVVTALTVRVHRARGGCRQGCYTQSSMGWEGNFSTDDGQMAEEVLHAYLKWVAGASRYWSSYLSLFMGEGGKYMVYITDALYVGTEEDMGDYWGLEEAMGEVHAESRVFSTRQTYNTYLEKVNDQAPESVNTANYGADPMVSVLLNASSAVDPSYARTVVDNWTPRCYRSGPGPACVAYYLFMHTVATGEEDDDYTGSAVSLPFRRAKVHVSSLAYGRLNEEGGVDDFPLEERVAFAHEVVGPAMYRYSGASYYSESEYSLQGDEWKERFWGLDIYSQLLEVKKTWDPTGVFSCRHCVGDGEIRGEVGLGTQPSWRRN